MKIETALNLIVGICLAIGIILFINFKTGMSFASLKDAFSVCDVNLLENCTQEQKQEMLDEIILEINKRDLTLENEKNNNY